MATFGALRPPWNRLLHPYRTHVLCPPNLCPTQLADHRPDLFLWTEVVGANDITITKCSLWRNVSCRQ